MPNTTPQLSPTRQALQAHFDECRKLAERLRDLEQPVRAFASAQFHEQECMRALESVAELEEADWIRWTAAPRGTPPSPRVEERAAAADHLADAHERTQRLRVGAEAVQKDIAETGEALAKLHHTTPTLIDPVLLEEASAMGSRFCELARLSHEICGILEGLLNHFRNENNGAGVEAIVQIMKSGRLPDRSKIVTTPTIKRHVVKNAAVVNGVTLDGQAIVARQVNDVDVVVRDYSGTVDYWTACSSAILAEYEQLKRIRANGRRIAENLARALRGDPTATLQDVEEAA